MHQKIAEAYLARYGKGEAIDKEQNRTATMEWKWQQINRLYRLALSMRLPLEADQDAERAIQKRWAWVKRLG